MPEAKTNLSLQEINVLETALELASANILTTIRHLERLGETKAADALRLTQNFIAPARELLNPSPIRAPLSSAFMTGRSAVENALRGAVAGGSDDADDHGGAMIRSDLNPAAQ